MHRTFPAALVAAFLLFNLTIPIPARAAEEKTMASTDPAIVAIEGYYRFQLTPWLAVSPDLQLIHDPGARATADDAWIAGLRMRVTL